MGLSAWQFGGVALGVSVAVSIGCGQTEDTFQPSASGTNAGGNSAQAGQRAAAMGGASERGGAPSGGAPGGGGVSVDAGGGHGALAGEGGEAGAGGTQKVTDGCSLAHHVEVPLSVQRYPERQVVKSGSEFAFTDGGTLLAMSWSGQLALQQFNQNDCNNCDALFGVTALRSELGWRMVSFDRTGPNGGTGTRAWSLGDQSPPEAQPLFGPEFSGLVSEFAVGTSRDGKRAMFANGHRGSRQVTFALIDADGRMVAPASAVAVPEHVVWNGLSIVPTEHASAISVTADSDDGNSHLWFLSELDASGQLVFSSQVTFPTELHCQMVVPDGCGIVADADGYFITLRDAAGSTRLARLLRAHPNELIFDDDWIIPAKSGLVAVFPETLVFATDESTSTTLQTRFVGLPKSGAGGEPRSLALTPGFSGQLTPRFELITVDGNSLFYGVRTQDKLTIEELDCSAAL
ncbi:MAG TPA: hypothetical protein VER96_05070 [Polyangiaceae bacterium]|nr:hypothetical protein [Polyangiaceae bacterium]